MTEFVMIRPTLRPDGKALHRVPMPGGYGLKAGMPLPAEGWRVPLDHFIRHLIHHKDAEIVTPAAATPAPAPGEVAVAVENPADSAETNSGNAA